MSHSVCLEIARVLFYTVLDRWMNDLRFFDLLNNISLISGRWVGDDVWFCAM